MPCNYVIYSSDLLVVQIDWLNKQLRTLYTEGVQNLLLTLLKSFFKKPGMPEFFNLHKK